MRDADRPSVRILVAGAGGILGREVCRLLLGKGVAVRGLVRAQRSAARVPPGCEIRVANALRAAALWPHMEGVEAVISCVGASVAPALSAGYRGYRAVDWPANRNLIDAAVRSGHVRRFVYVSLHGVESLRGGAYVEAHERVVEYLRASMLQDAVLRPTGLFAAFASVLPLAQRGPLPLIGSGTARTNPIHEADVAAACVDLLDELGRTHRSGLERSVGGPEVYTRAELGEAIFAALRRPPRFRRMSRGQARLLGRILGVFTPRMGDLLQFIADVSSIDIVAPAAGQQQLKPYLAQAATRLRGSVRRA